VAGVNPGLVADVAGEGPAVVALHGQPGSAADWAGVAALLRSTFTVIAPDRLGYGRTGGRAAGFAANADATCELLDRLERPSAVVVGHSWAGGVALALAQAHPERVDALVLVASVSPTETVGIFDRLLAVPPIGIVVATIALGSAGRALAHPAVRVLVERRLSSPTSETLARTWSQGGLARSFAVEQRCLVDELAGLAPGLGALGVPAVVVAGTADRIVAPATGDRLAAALPGSTLVRVAGAGHLLPLDRPAAVAAAVREAAHRAGLVGTP
jgi:pimeloyl-ACP methyl ester carboxylesterase